MPGERIAAKCRGREHQTNLCQRPVHFIPSQGSTYVETDSEAGSSSRGSSASTVTQGQHTSLKAGIQVITRSEMYFAKRLVV